jgi:hypothetical protein
MNIQAVAKNRVSRPRSRQKAQRSLSMADPPNQNAHHTTDNRKSASPDAGFGIPTRPSTPMYGIISNLYGRVATEV